MKWVDIRDQLPERRKRVFVYDPCFGVTEAMRRLRNVNDEVTFIISTEYGSHELLNVTHWMPLPEPPENSNE